MKSTVTGLFKILTYAVSNEEKFERPFYIDSRQNENQRDELSPQENTSINDPPTRIIFVNPKEVSLSDTIMNELSVICNMAADGKHLPIISHFVEEYISLSLVTVDFAPSKSSEEFARVTDWFSQLLLMHTITFRVTLRSTLLFHWLDSIMIFILGPLKLAEL